MSNHHQLLTNAEPCFCPSIQIPLAWIKPVQKNFIIYHIIDDSHVYIFTDIA